VQAEHRVRQTVAVAAVRRRYESVLQRKAAAAAAQSASSPGSNRAGPRCRAGESTT
jgi:hypothetical protein